MAADKSIGDIDLADFKTPNRRNSGLIKGAEVFHRISDEPEPEGVSMPDLELSPIKEYVKDKSGMLKVLTMPDPKSIDPSLWLICRFRMFFGTSMNKFGSITW